MDHGLHLQDQNKLKTEVSEKESIADPAVQLQQSGSLCKHRIVVAKSLEDIEKIRGDWQYLEDKFGRNAPFSNYIFFQQLCHTFDEKTKPHVIVVYDDAEPIALLIGRQTVCPVFCLKAIGLEILSMRCWTIFFDGIITNDKASSIDAAIDYFDCQLKSGGIDILNLQHIPLNDKAAMKIVHYLQDRFKSILKPEFHLYRELRDAETGLENCTNSSKTMSTFRRKDRKLTTYFGGSLEMQMLSSICDLQPFIEDAASIVSQTYQSALGTGVTNDQHWQTITQALASIGSFRGYLLKSNNILISYVLGAVVNDRFTLFATGFLPKYQKFSPGTVLMNRVLTSLTEEGVNVVDLGFGDASYKRLHATQIEEDLSIQVYGKGFLSSLEWTFISCTSITLRIAKHTLRKLGLKRITKRIWRQHLLRRSMRSLSTQ